MAGDTNSNEVKMTYETLFELLRREKNRVELQPIDPSFYRDFVEYLKTKKQLLQEKQAKASNLGLDDGEVTKLMIQIDNISKIMKELYERREKKIVSLALLSSRSGPSISKEGILELEDQFYQELVSLFSKFRKGILANVLSQHNPEIPQDQHASSQPAKKTDAKDAPETNESSTRLVRFLSNVPKFVGEELESYGPYEPEEITILPSKIAKILIDTQKAEEITEE